MFATERRSYKSFAEAKETLTPQEERFEKWRNTIGLFLGPLVALWIYWAPMPSLSPQAHTLAAIIAWVGIWWITEPIPIPMSALLGAVLCVLFGIADAKKVFAPFADPIIQLFLGSFMLAEAMALHGLDKRFAYGIMSLKWVGSSTGRIMFAFGVICGVLSMWISNTAATAMMFPIGLGIIYAMADVMSQKTGEVVDATRLRFGTGMMLMTAYAASAGGIGTPVGTPPNLIGIAMIEKFVGVKIPFFQWMLFAIPLLVILFCILFVVMYYLHKPEITHIEGSHEYVMRERAELGAWTTGQKNALLAFLVTVVLWIIPGILAVLYGTDHPISKAYNRYMPEGVAALIGATLLFLLPVSWKDREFTISWGQATKIDWGTLLLFGGGITLGNLMFESKLAEAVGSGLLALSGASSLWGITFGAIFIAILVSETSSNTASANMVVPVMISLAVAAGVNPIPPAIGATLGASWGFMLPVSTPPNAIVYGSGMIPIIKMIRAGVFFDIIGGLGIWVGLWILLPLVGLA
ncbi:SLC13 family permease [Desulfomonile tiedjei]|uniref:Anion transporter n=1 Tax=Desulfomonile tiedjei (strain ATCC 49306 / DSM 6799 / DCB-1) TaxID=706587 RepID=I4C260_DESTA|nr:DASS family sodium-coupled anion symporter [Desulfomonile tiedjei]AFM23651.1 anion transporter [Desulfomonile tiedjei DSM 6799]